MVDETTDLSNTEQMVLCLRYVDDNLEVHEELIARGSHSNQGHLAAYESDDQQLSWSVL